MSETCDICGRPTSTNRWCGPDMCSAYWAGRHPGADLAMAVCYRIGRELVRAERDALRAELARLTTWHPASEPPEVGVCVLAHYRDGSSGFDYWSDESGWESDGTVTHWHKLPPGPEVTP